MANSNNVYGTQQPLRDNISDWVGNQEQLNFAQREEARKIAALGEAKKLRDEKAKKDLEESYALKVGPATGIASFDQAYNEFYTDAIAKNHELYKKEKAGQPLTNDELVMKKNLQNLPEKLSLLSKSYVDNNKTYSDWIKAGNHRDLDYEMSLNGMATNAKAFLDKQGNPVIGIDKDGDGKVDFLHSDFEGLTIKPNFTKAYDYDKEIKAIADNLAPERTVNESGYVKTTSEGLPPRIAKSAATASVYNADGTPSDFAKSLLYPLNPKDITEKELTALEGRITESLLNSKKRVNERDVDYGSMNAAQREARQARKETKDIPVIGTPVPPSQDAWGPQYKNIDTRNKLSVPVTGGEIKLPALSIKTGTTTNKTTGVTSTNKKEVTDAVVENYTYDKDGRMVVDYSYKGPSVSIKGDDGTTVKESPKLKGQTKVTPETEARIAKQLRMTVKELRESANNPDASKETAAERALRIANGG